MYFNCPQHKRDFSSSPFLYIRRIFFTFNKNDFDSEKTFESLKQTEFEDFIDKIHHQLAYFLAFKIATFLYILYFASFLISIIWASFNQEDKASAFKLMVFSGFLALVCGCVLRRLQAYYCFKVRMIIDEENYNLSYRNIYWEIGPGISYLTLKKHNEDSLNNSNLCIETY